MATTATVDARPMSVDLYLYAGDDINLHLDVTDDANAPVDLTGYTAMAQIRATADAPLSVDFDATITASAIDLTMASADTTDLPARGVWDVQVASATGAITTLVTGKVIVTAEVSR